MLAIVSSPEISTTREALAELGVTDQILSADEIQSIDRDGFVVLRDVIDPDWLARLREVYESLMKEKYGDIPAEVTRVSRDHWYHEAGTRRLTNLVSADPVFDGMYTNPRLLAAVRQFLGDDFVLDALNARDALPGHGAQGFHRDRNLLPDGGFTSVNSGWLLDDFTVENGATRFVPGSHRWSLGPEEALADAMAPHPEQVIPLATAGSVVVFNAHIWHSGTLNRTASTRRVVHCSFSISSIGQIRDKQKDLIRKSTYDRISPAARRLLDV